MISPARVAAYEILRREATGRSDLPASVALVRERLADERDRSLATDIAVGTVRWRAKLDYLIEQVARRPAARLDPEVLDILRSGAYQLLHLTRVPAAAVVDDAVNLTRKAGKKSASGLVNAVLRGISRRRTALPLPPKPSTSDDRESALDYLSITLSHPRWLVARWLARVGFERTEAWLHFNNQPAPLTLRALEGEVARNRLREELEASGSDVRNGLYAPLAVVVESGHLPGMSTAHRFVIQDEASQLVALLSGPAPGPLVLDACASPGGKATAIAATLTESELLIACDVRPRRMALLRRTIASAGATNIRLVQLDLTQALPFADSFSTVMVDAPCSGLGTLRRDPDIRWRQTPDALPSFAAKQQLMLDNAAAVIAPGGRLVYATCSSEPEENEQVADGFLARHPEFAPVPASRAHPAIATELEDPRGHFRTEPDRHGLEHFFGAVFQRSHL